MAEVKFVDELPERTRQSAWVDKLEQVMERPGKWAQVWEGKITSAYSTAGSLRSGGRTIPDGQWEFATRTLDKDNDLGAVFARYLGPDEPETEPEEEQGSVTAFPTSASVGASVNG